MRLKYKLLESRFTSNFPKEPSWFFGLRKSSKDFRGFEKLGGRFVE